MPIRTMQDLINHIGIYGKKNVSQIKMENGEYRKVSYIQLQKNAKLLAAYLEKARHLKKGGMCAICSENRPEWFMGYYGIVYNGIWAVPIDARLTSREIKNLVLDCGAKTIILSKSIYDTISGEQDLMKHVSEFIVFDPDDNMLKQKNVKSLEQVLEEAANYELKDQKVEPEDVASLIYTSGTTGKPKGVMLTNRNFISQVEAMKEVLPIGIEDTELSVLPLHHTFEFTIENVFMHNGSTITYAESLKANKLLSNIRETEVTIMIAIPLLYEKIYDGIMRKIGQMKFPVKQIIMMMFNSAKRKNQRRGNNIAGQRMFGFLRKKAGLHNISFMVSGAAPLNFKVAQGFDGLGLNLLNGYGLTESSPVISVNRLNYKVRNDSVGIPIPEVQVKIHKPDIEGNGEIMAYGPNIMKGYYKNKQATEEVITEDGWLHTGDIGKIEEHEGNIYLYITGRSKNMIVTPGGKNVYPEELEEFINNHDAVLESLVLGVPISEEDRGENIYAYIVPNYEYLDSLENIQGFKNTEEHIEKIINEHMKDVNSQLKPYQKIRQFRIRREEFPKTSTKKVKRYLFTGEDFMQM